MARLITRIQSALLGGAGEDKVRALLTELAIPAGDPSEGALRDVRNCILRPMDSDAELRTAFANLGLSGNGTGERPLPRIRAAIFSNLRDSETTLRDGLNDLLGAGNLGGGTAPSDIVWAGSHVIAEGAVLGSQIGGALSVVDTKDTITFSLVNDAGGLFGINGTSVIVTGVIDYETATSHNITIRATNGTGLTRDEIFAITVTDVNETPPPLDPDDGDIIVDDPATFVIPPTVVSVDDAIAFQGNKKKGASGKFIFDIGTPVAGTIYTVQYDPDWSLLANGGRTAMVGFGLRTDNDFRLSGLKGDELSGLLRAYEVFGSNKWDKTSGFSLVDGGVALHGTQAGPNWMQLEVAEDGSTYTLRTSSDGIDWVDEFTDRTPSPFAAVDGVTSFGIAVFLDANDAGPFRVDITLWTATGDFSPASLAGLIGWWDASVTASLNLTGSDINSVADQSGGGRTMSWVGAFSKPIYSATGFNSTYPAMIFTLAALQTNTAGSGTFPMGTGNTLTLWLVTTMGDTSTMSYGRYFSYGVGGGADWNTAASWFFGRNSTTPTQCAFYRNSIVTASSSTTAHPAPHRLIVTVNAGAITIYIDGVSVGTGTSAGNWGSPGRLIIGSGPATGDYWYGPIAECGVATGFSDATTVGQLDTYLKNKWGL